MASRPKKVSPILDVSASIIGEASERLIPDSSSFNHTFEVSTDAIVPDPAQARRNFDEKSLAALAATLEAEGQLQPILVRRDPQQRHRWIIVAGERRWRAAKLLKWPKLLAMPHSGDAEIAGLIENLQRIDLSPVEEARGITRLLTEKGWTQDQAAQALGKQKSEVSGTLRILSIPENVLREVLTSEHPPAKNVLVEMARITDVGMLDRLVEQARAGTLTVKVIRALRDKPLPPSPIVGPRPARPIRQPWHTLEKAQVVVRELATSKVLLSPHETASLHELRAAIDHLLKRSQIPPLDDQA